ncbi:MAG TPA: hypothetical protein VGX28_02985 [Frankiaceae bacterium]|jgi:hypothetical protein|nr:hypothetical protein [Frankiaceae bacterium]
MDRSSLARRVAPFAVFAAVLGGVVAVGRGTDGARREPHPLRLGAASGRSAEDAGTTAPGAPAYYGGARHVPDRLLEGLPAEGPAYAVRDGNARLDALARALGVGGEARRVERGWVVGTGDRVLQVMEQPGRPWYLGARQGEGGAAVGVGVAVPGSAPGAPGSAPAKPSAPPDAPTGAPAGPSSGSTDTPPAPPPAKPQPCPVPTDGRDVACAAPVPLLPPTLPPQPTDAEARAVADRILAALGRGASEVVMTPGYLGKDVSAAPVLDGLPTFGWETRVTVDARGGIVNASGHLGDATLDARYPLLDPRRALERTGQARDLPAGAEPAPGAPVASPPVREATRVRLGLMLVPSWEEGAYLVPAWLVTFSGFEEPYLALPDRYVATPPPPTGDPGDPDEPVCDPAPCPDAPDAPPPPDAGTSAGGAPGSTGAPE